LTLTKLFLARYEIEVYALSVAVVSRQGRAKTPVGTRLGAGQRPGLAALYKTLCYAVATFLLIFGA
jgi:hypothetical protein